MVDPVRDGVAVGIGRVRAAATQLPARAGGALGLVRRLRAPAAQRDGAYGQALLKQAAVGAHGRVGHEAAAHYIVKQAVCNGGQAHAEVVRHDAAHALAAAARGARGRVVHGLPEPEAAREAQRTQPPQIAHRRLRLHGEGQEARVGRDDEIRLHAPPERQRGAAVGLVAVAQRRVEREKRALGLAPGLAVRHVPALDVEAKARTLVEQAVPAQRQEELRHEIFEHRARPAGHAAVAVLGHEGAGELAPVPPRHVAARHGEIAREPRLAREQVVEPLRELARALVPADAEEAALSVIERRELHRVVERAGARGEVGPRIIGHAAAQHGEAGCEVAAVHGGDVLRQQRAQSARVVPVI